MEKKIKNVLNYYLLTSKLKDTIRSGWKMWNVKKERLESVAEHVYGTCMLATAIWSETLPPINLAEVLMTLAIHETEEIVIGDLTPFDKGYNDKKIKGEQAIKEVFKDLIAKEVFETLIKNFDEQSTPEAIFAYKCDKLECDLQAKIYDEAGVMKLENASEKVQKDERIKKLQARGVKKASTFFLYFDRPNLQKFVKDDEQDIFIEISKYIEKNRLTPQETQKEKPTTTTAKKK